MARTFNDFDSVDLCEDDQLKDGEHGFCIETIASSLLKEKLLLTALELHSELTERGKELNLLRDYFSNPVHFEQPLQVVPQVSEGFQPQLSRSNSVQTLESLEFSRYSDDGDKQRDEKIAVLEFELRKAKYVFVV